ncbi:hypothetical protein LCGC14_1735530 [marine sediment metagenome]|uniref:Uncharacterized protein n=1 Tax=marine sediment metagenome TaxID=412755 RepID=A0A0F9HVV8_9ZZZZ
MLVDNVDEYKIYPYYWRILTELPHRKGTPCKILTHEKNNSVRIEFEDGYKVFTSRYHIRRRDKYRNYEVKSEREHSNRRS